MPIYLVETYIPSTCSTRDHTLQLTIFLSRHAAEDEFERSVKDRSVPNECVILLIEGKLGCALRYSSAATVLREAGKRVGGRRTLDADV